MNVDIRALQLKYKLDHQIKVNDPSSESATNTVSASADIINEPNHLHDIIDSLQKKLSTLLDEKIKSMIVTNQSEQSKQKKNTFYILRFTRDNLEYKDIENELSVKHVSIDFKTKQATKNNTPYSVDSLQKFNKIVFNTLYKDIKNRLQIY